MKLSLKCDKVAEGVLECVDVYVAAAVRHELLIECEAASDRIRAAKNREELARMNLETVIRQLAEKTLQEQS